jgi:hypothetical protein
MCESCSYLDHKKLAFGCLVKVYLALKRAIKGPHQKQDGESRIRKVPGTPDHTPKRHNPQGLRR